MLCPSGNLADHYYHIFIEYCIDDTVLSLANPIEYIIQFDASGRSGIFAKSTHRCDEALSLALRNSLQLLLHIAVNLQCVGHH